MKKALFIDRDGTLIYEPEDFQVDSLEKLRFMPGVISWLGRIAQELDYELVMVTNQDGLGTDKFPMESFMPFHNFILQTLESEGIRFSDVCIDCSLEHESKPTRKPGTAMLTKYLSGGYDLENSIVIGDRITDIELAKNLGCKAIFLKNQYFEAGENDGILVVSESWKEIYEFLKLSPRKVSHRRTT